MIPSFVNIMDGYIKIIDKQLAKKKQTFKTRAT